MFLTLTTGDLNLFCNAKTNLKDRFGQVQTRLEEKLTVKALFSPKEKTIILPNTPYTLILSTMWTRGLNLLRLVVLHFGGNSLSWWYSRCHHYLSKFLLLQLCHQLPVFDGQVPLCFIRIMLGCFGYTRLYHLRNRLLPKIFPNTIRWLLLCLLPLLLHLLQWLP